MQFFSKNFAIIVIVAMAFFIELLDTTIINTSIPQIAESFNAAPLTIKIAITSYLMALAIFIPISGWLADKFGTKKIFLSAIVIFTLSSLFCGLSQSIFQLALFRFIQGIGGALMIPIGRLIVLQSFSNQDLLKIMSYISLIALIGPVLGPLLGGYITTYYSWHWIFFINIPLGIFEFLMAYKFIPNEIAKMPKKLDIKGFILIAIGLTLIAFSAENISENLISKAIIWTLLLIGIGFVFLYIIHSKKTENSILDLNLFKINSFQIGNIQLLISIIAAGGISFILPIMLQTYFKLNPLYSGLFTAPIAFGAILIRPFIPYIVKYFGYKKLLTLNTLLLSSCIFAFYLISNINYFYLIFLGIIYGVFYTIQISCSAVIGYLNIEAKDKSAATSLQSTNQQFSLTLCICINAFLIHLFTLNNSQNSGITHNIEAFQYTFLTLSVIFLLNLFFIRKLRI
ncbi:DHA2 family efflux MFS transporter permease subunit [Pigmentibacter sp. JX0631]|uniref:DHA2 family efflux MFS transporter permease subunit n=1 Tax=Pigmentibacter sp. JX0631 TaxID=2976982 RepID=UPI0024699E22|nr:DHA2 family efflux MFS transporter permease subunit [Pigmentibacter sp. JX0631]WGL60950.1 DHA2 family efflux MFS transporter permease subunit [Pigmentibacter sp. JX0631]